MYINNRHLQILKLIKNNNNLTSKEIGDLFSMSAQHTKLYLEDIYSKLYNSEASDIKSTTLIEKISSSKNSRNKLKKTQEFSKNEKIFYLLFRLIKDKYINLSKISDELGITKRNLNYYLTEISIIMKNYNLKFKATNKGLQLIGTNFSFKHLTYLLTFKFCIEKEFLPTKIRNEVISFLKIDNFCLLKKDIYSFMSLISSEYTTHKTSSIFSFYFAFRVRDNEVKIGDMSEEFIYRHKPAHFEDEFFKKIVYFFKNSSFKYLNTNSISELITIIDTIYYSHRKFQKQELNKSVQLRPIFAKYLGDQIYKNNSFFTIINPWVYYTALRARFSIEDSAFLKLNLEHIYNSNVLSLTKEINSIIPNFTIFETLSVWYQLSEFEDNSIKNIFIFRDLNINIVPIIVNEIYKKHNIKISEYINVRSLRKYLKENSVDNIITVENIKLYDSSLNVKNIFFPIPNYKKINP
ncbi:hypothetical protein [Cetobacterium sp. ZOR0034]|uniref:hypothetical protein n=1 Tax=Cetobacterium sp. ZOR0034 TaxID=1339239 RepID=UPI000647ED8C|nr:hypothetical protein [Cetobacterium sp. ZOR0034]